MIKPRICACGAQEYADAEKRPSPYVCDDCRFKERLTTPMTPDELKAQRESWVRGEMAMGSDKDEAEYRAKVRGPAPCASDVIPDPLFGDSALNMPKPIIETKCKNCGEGLKQGLEFEWVHNNNGFYGCLIGADGRITYAEPTTISGFLCPTHGMQHGAERCNECDNLGRSIGEMDWRTEMALIGKSLNRRDLLAFHKQLCEEAHQLMRGKNTGYASDDDPLKNFDAAEAVGLTAIDSILCRWQEKLSRAANAIRSADSRAAVANEGLRDIILDAINFPILAFAWLVREGYFEEKK